MISKLSRKFLRPATIVPVFLTLILIIIIAYFQIARSNGTSLTMLAVGQADATLFETGSGVRVLIDAGQDEAAANQLSRIMPWWDKRIDVLVLTHEHSDHVGGVISLIKRFRIGKVIAPAEVAGADELSKAVQELRAQQIPFELITSNYELHFSRSSSLILIPDHGVGANEHSLVGILKDNGATALLMGDAGFDQEEKITNGYISEGVDLLKIGHHGSDTATSEVFLSRVKPKYAVISVGKNNRYGLPSGRVLARLKRFGVPYFRTDELGDITFHSLEGQWQMK